MAAACSGAGREATLPSRVTHRLSSGAPRLRLGRDASCSGPTVALPPVQLPGAFHLCAGHSAPKFCRSNCKFSDIGFTLGQPGQAQLAQRPLAWCRQNVRPQRGVGRLPLRARHPPSPSKRPAPQPRSMGDAGRKRWLELLIQTAVARQGNFLPRRTTGGGRKDTGLNSHLLEALWPSLLGESRWARGLST